MKKLILILLCLVLTSGAGCARQVESTLPPTPLVEQTVQPSPEPSATPQPTLTPTPGIPAAPDPSIHYRLDAVLDYPAKTVSVDEWVEYTHTSSQPVQELVFIVHASLFPYVFQYQRGTLGDGQTELSASQEAGRLTVRLPEPLDPGKTIQLTISFLLALPEREGTLGFTSRQVNLANWFPMLAPYVDGQGWLVHEPGGFGEYTVFSPADFDVRLKVIGDGLIAAASAAGVPEGEWTRYQLFAARNFAVSISPFFQTKEQAVGSTRVVSYWFTDYPQAGDTALQTASQALTLFNDLFGVYPRESLSVVESDFLHGMEYDGLFFLSRGFYENYPGTPQSNLVIIAAHETSHQWWYSLVANDQAVEPWLDESLATYCELLFYEKYYPDLVNWWWDNRVKFFQPAGWVDSDIYNPGGYEAYRNAVYLRGALFMADLRSSVGDAAFFAFLKDYAGSRAYQISSRPDFFSILARHTQVDLTPIQQTYFEKPTK